MRIGEEIRMEYPLDSTGENPAYDGTVHRVIPRGINELIINNRPFYVMHYHDLNIGRDCITLLTAFGNHLVKVPLDEYDSLIEYINQNHLTPLDSINIPGDIELAETMSANALLHPTAASSMTPPTRANFVYPNYKPYYPHVEYVPLHHQYGNATYSGCYSFSHIFIGPYDKNGDYHYRKAPDYPEKEFAADYGAARYIRNQPGSEKYEFNIEIGEEGRRGLITSVDRQGKPVYKEVWLLPGIHHYEMHYAPCKYRTDYLASRLGRELIINAPFEEYHDLHGKKEVFEDGMIGILDARFYDHTGKELESIDRGQKGFVK